MALVRPVERARFGISLRASLVFALAMPACHAQGPVAETPTHDASTTDAANVTCRADKLRFTRDDGCVNDGSVELCIANGDDATRDAVLAIAHDAVCHRGSAGRARCDTATEMLCLIPMGETECTGRHGAMLDAAWGRICAIAALDGVRAIVPTWYE